MTSPQYPTCSISLAKSLMWTCATATALCNQHIQTASSQWRQNSTNPLNENLLIVCTHMLSCQIFWLNKIKKQLNYSVACQKELYLQIIWWTQELCCGTVFYDYVNVMIICCLNKIACQPPTASTQKNQQSYRLKKKKLLKIKMHVFDEESSKQQCVTVSQLVKHFLSPSKMDPKPPTLHCSRNWFYPSLLANEAGSTKLRSCFNDDKNPGNTTTHVV